VLRTSTANDIMTYFIKRYQFLQTSLHSARSRSTIDATVTRIYNYYALNSCLDSELKREGYQISRPRCIARF